MNASVKKTQNNYRFDEVMKLHGDKSTLFQSSSDAVRELHRRGYEQMDKGYYKSLHTKKPAFFTRMQDGRFLVTWGEFEPQGAVVHRRPEK